MENKILKLEKKYWKGMENHDFETVKNLTRFPCIVVSKDGVRSIDELVFKRMFDSSENAKINVLNISEVQTQMYNDHCAVIAYQIELENMINEQGSSMKCICTSTWIKEDNHWVCALHTEVELA